MQGFCLYLQDKLEHAKQLSAFQSKNRPYMDKINEKALNIYERQYASLPGGFGRHLNLGLFHCELTLDELSSLTTTPSAKISQQFRRFKVESIPEYYDYADTNGAYVDFANYKLGGAVLTYGLVIVPFNVCLTCLTLNHQSGSRRDNVSGVARALGISDCQCEQKPGAIVANGRQRSHRPDWS